MQKRYNDYLPYKTPAMRREPKCKNSMEFVNCVVFIKETGDLSVHREFNDNEWHFYALGNIGDSKKTDSTRANDPSDIKEFVIEVSDNTMNNSIFQTGYTNTDGTFKYPIKKSEWVPGNPAYDSLYNDWDGSFEFRYDMGGLTKDGVITGTTTEEIEAQREANKQVWRDFYEWVITSTDEEFKTQLNQWTIEDSILYWYLFTHRYTMTDSRAKNTFWHYGKVYISSAEAETMGEEAQYYTIDDDAVQYHDGYRFELWDYDNDTALGIDNNGELNRPYGKEDTDFEENGSDYIFNGAKSTLWCRVRDLKHKELCALYQKLDIQGCWSASGLIAEFDAWQNEFPEEIWRLNFQREYHRTCEGSSLDNSIPKEKDVSFIKTKLNGRKRYHRRQFERDQELYMASKYLSNTATADRILFRCVTPENATITPNYDLRLTPYSDMYLSVLFGNTNAAQQVRAKAGQEYVIKCPFSYMSDTQVLIYVGSRIQGINDLSAAYIKSNDFSTATKLKTLVIGSAAEGYVNDVMTELIIGDNKILEVLDVRNIKNLAGSINLSGCENLRTFLADGTSITSVIFATNGKIQTASLPGTINALTMKELKYLTDLRIASYGNMESLTIENSIVDSYDLTSKSIDTLHSLRIVGVDWNIVETDVLNKIVKLYSSALFGKVYITGYVRNQELLSYANAWSELVVQYNPENIIPQQLVIFVDYDGTELYRTYVDRGTTVKDPCINGLIDPPTRESSVSTVYTYSGWAFEFNTKINSDTTIYAKYTESTREYTVRWYLNEASTTPICTATCLYGHSIEYDEERYGVPSYGSVSGIYRLFAGWDKHTGYITGDTNVYAVFEEANIDKNKKLADMRPAEINALIQGGVLASNGGDNNNTSSEYYGMVTSGDSFNILMGHDYDFDNIESIELVSVNDPKTFTGSNYFKPVDKNGNDIKLFDKEKAFTIAVDYSFTKIISSARMMSCYSRNTGIEIACNSEAAISRYGTVNSQSLSVAKDREIVVMRHEAGTNELHVYSSNKMANEQIYTMLTSTVANYHSSPLVFGCVMDEDGYVGDYATGAVYWAKLWYNDIGDYYCKKIASWPRENIEMQAVGSSDHVFRTFERTDTGTYCNCSFLMKKVFDTPTQLGSYNVYSWKDADLRTWLNQRIVKALPDQWRYMLKKVKLTCLVDDGENEIGTVTVDDFIWLPSASNLGLSSSYSNSSLDTESNVIFNIFTTSSSLIKVDSSGKARYYWTRSPIDGGFILVNEYGYASSTNASGSYYVHFGICI